MHLPQSYKDTVPFEPQETAILKSKYAGSVQQADTKDTLIQQMKPILTKRTGQFEQTSGSRDDDDSSRPD